MLSRRQFFTLPPSRGGLRLPGYWMHFHRSAMACRFEVTLPTSERWGAYAAQEALGEIERLEAQLTIFRDTSELSYINRNAASVPVSVEPRLFALLLECLELHRSTEGAFDITTGPLSRCWGFLERQGRLPEPAELERARALAGMGQVLLDPGSLTVRFSQPGVELNLGSIGKGYALDRAGHLIRKRGVRSALLSGGGSSVLAVGAGERGEGWLVGVRHARNPNARIARLRLFDCAMGTSGTGEQFFEKDGKRYSHVIDPRTGAPVEGRRSVTVVAGSAAKADALATAFLVGGRELAERYCAANRGVLALLVEENEPNRLVIAGSNNRVKVETVDE